MLSGLHLNIPTLVAGAVMALAWAYACLSFAGYLRARGLQTGYTRKVFHALIFLSAAVAQASGGFVAVCVFGTMVSLVVGLAVLRGPKDRQYEAIAREQDGPARTYYIVTSYFATLIGGLASNILFGPLAVVGYLVGGLGDAAGEPASTRWGRRYLSARGSKTFEGSIAVLAASLVALVIAVAVTPQLHLDLRAVIALPLIAFVCTLVEAFSPRGWDNVPMQVVPTLLVTIFLLK